MASGVLEVARRLAPRLAARADEYDRTGAFPVEDFADLREAGLFGVMVPRRLGGLGASFSDYVAVAYELAQGNGATALVYNMHVAVTGALSAITDELAEALGLPEEALAARDRILAAAAAGSWYAVATSERGVGSRLSRLSTVYEAVDGGYRIKGVKSFCSGAGYADGYLVAARSVVDESRVSQFLVPATVSGLRVEPTWDALGMRATASHDVHLDLTVPRDALVGGVEGLALVAAQLMPHWMVASYAAVYVGVARAAVDAARADVAERGLGGLPAVRSRIGRADAEVAAAWLVVQEAARRVDAAPGDPETNAWVWRAKLLAGETAARVAASMVEAAGASATRRGHPLERLYRDARCGALQPPTSDVCADWLGVAALGGDPDRDGVAPRW
ncbi:MAG TPA: acyl-CoA dehydrogenase family protein [Micromonospora sp.]